jgi:N6-L-threonylcarbamoyladenine synthase
MRPQQTVLGIETSCDETAAAVVRVGADGRAEVASSIVLSQVDQHAPFGGVVPEIAARAHVEAIDWVITAAMQTAGIGYEALTGVAATAGPGLVGGVMVGLSTGKAIALARGLPLVAVNHLEGHAVSARLTADLPYPFLLLLISGGHCQLLDVEGVGRCTRLGSTIDDAAGEAFDKIAKALGLPYPGGPALEALAEGGDAARFALPNALAGREGCDFSFSGLKTAAARIAERVVEEDERRDLAACVQAAIARQLAERSERAMEMYAERHPLAPNLTAKIAKDAKGLLSATATVRSRNLGELGVLGGRKRLRREAPSGEGSATPHPSASLTPSPPSGRRERRFVVAGGVAANAHVRQVLRAAAESHGFSFTAPPLAYCGDNAAMIALAGAERLALGLSDGMDAVARPRWPLDEAAARLRPTHIPGRKGAKA